MDEKNEKTTTLYEAIGGDATVRALTDRFYALMKTTPEGKASLDVHPPDLTNARDRLYDYLTGYLGGPPVYMEKYGHPMLRRRHFVAPIGPEERDSWLFCFRQALEETVENPALRDIIWRPVEQLAHHMQNKE